MRAILLVLSAGALWGQTAEEIMARVAENQSRAETARASVTYRRNVLVRLKHGNHACDAVRDYDVMPGERNVKAELTASKETGCTGKIDPEVAKGIAEDFGNDRRARDGVNRGMFPLSAKEQKRYTFRLEGREKYRERDVFRVTFRDADGDWAGEALIDAEEFQPVTITTHLAKGVPLAVKTLAGTDLREMGFKITYKKFEDGLWFPVSYGGELKVKVLFFVYNRTISVGVSYSDFRRVSVDSSVTFEQQQ